MVRGFCGWHISTRATYTELKYPSLIGASLGEPHSYVFTWTFVIRDKYINRPSDRLALHPRRSNQNLAQIPYFDFAFLWLWLTMISSRKDTCARALIFLSSPTALGVQLPSVETNLIWIFSTSVLSFFTRLSDTRAASVLSFFTHLSDTRDRRLASEIPLSTLVAVDRLTSVGSVRRRCTKTLRKQPVRGTESWRHRHFVFSRLGLAFTASPCIVWQVARDRWHLLERTRLRFHRRKTERTVQGSPHKACIP